MITGGEIAGFRRTAGRGAGPAAAEMETEGLSDSMDRSGPLLGRFRWDVVLDLMMLGKELSFPLPKHPRFYSILDCGHLNLRGSG
jgi:hypothetical protein